MPVVRHCCATRKAEDLRGGGSNGRIDKVLRVRWKGRSDMMNRRFFLAATATLILPESVFAAESRLTFKGAIAEGGLVIGSSVPSTTIRLDGKALRVSRDGSFAFGFAYDQKRAAVIEAHFADGSNEKREVMPTIRSYNIQSITGLPEPFVTPPADILERIKRETAVIAEARKRDTESTSFTEGFDWPTAGIMSSTYGSQRILNGEPRAPHLAVDIAAPTGTPIHAPADGIVSLTGEYYLNGGFTIIDHGHGVSTNYVHQSKRLVKVGDKVTRGQIIGEVGATGRAT